jgi:hypothetical protein
MARKEKQYHFIYKTTNLLNDKYYYGMHSTDNLNDGYYGSGRRLKRSLNKYGKENHKIEIIEHLPNRKSLIEREKEIVNLNEIAKEECMNLMIGGKGGFISEEQQRHRSSCGGKATGMKLKNDIEFRKYHNNIASQNLKKYHNSGKAKYNTFTNKKHTEETKRKIGLKNSIKQKGNNNSQFGTCWITNGVDNKKIFKNNDIPDGWKLGRKI